MAAAALTLATAAGAAARVLVVGGGPAPPGSWPSTVALISASQPDPNVGQFCGGTLIDQGWVLTAAHCTFDYSVTPPTALTPGQIDALLGATDLTNLAGTQRIDVAGIVRHPAFNTSSLTSDVALLQLSAPATLGAGVAVMDLVSPAQSSRWAPGISARVAGWGATNSGGTLFPSVLQEGDVTLVADASCGGALGGAFSAATMLCAGDGDPDVCVGDSGGPLVVASATGQPALVGATSWGSAGGCALPGVPSVYARLDALRAFIYGPSGVPGVDPPGAPGIGTAAAGPASATVTWTAPASNGGRTITGYRVIATPVAGGAAVQADVAATPLQATVGGLTPGTQYRLTVEAANTAGWGAASSQSAPVTPAAAPVANGVPPGLAGIPVVGSVLSGSDGQWTGEPLTLSRAWQRETAPGSGTFSDIPGQTGSSYAIAAGDAGLRVRFSVTGSNTINTVTAVSGPSAPIAPVLSVVTVPRVMGVPALAVALVADTGAWNIAATLAHRWQREPAPGSGAFIDIPGAGGAGYSPVPADVGLRLRVVVTATAPFQVAESASAPTAPVAPGPPTALAAPAVIGVPRVGRVVTASPGAWADAHGAPSLQWQSCDRTGACSDIPGATGTQYRSTARDRNRRLRVGVSVTGPGGSAAAVSAMSAAVRAPLTLRAAGATRTTVRGATVRIDLRLRTEPGARLWFVVVAGGRVRPIIASASRIDGRRTRRAGAAAIGTTRSGSVHRVTIVARRGTRAWRGVRVLVRATAPQSERASLSLPARVPA